MREAHLHRILLNWLLKLKKWFTAISVSYSSNRWQSHTHAGMLEIWASSPALSCLSPSDSPESLLKMSKWDASQIPHLLPLTRSFSGTIKAAIDIFMYKYSLQTLTVKEMNVPFGTKGIHWSKLISEAGYGHWWKNFYHTHLTSVNTVFYNSKVSDWKQSI